MAKTATFDVTDLSDEQVADIHSHIRGLSEPETPTYPVPSHGWTCFHCGQTFKDFWGARLHFGKTPEQVRPTCQN